MCSREWADYIFKENILLKNINKSRERHKSIKLGAVNLTNVLEAE